MHLLFSSHLLKHDFKKRNDKREAIDRPIIYKYKT